MSDQAYLRIAESVAKGVQTAPKANGGLPKALIARPSSFPGGRVIMARSLRLLAISALAVAIPCVASAALLEWSGTNKIRLGTNPMTVTPGTGVATVNGSSGLGHLTTFRLRAGDFANTPAYLITDPGVPTIATLMQKAQNGPGTLRPISGGGPLTMNTLPIQGNTKVCLLLAGCSAWLDLLLTETGDRWGNGHEGFGIGGTVTVNGFGAGVRLSLSGAPWTVATAAVTGAFTTNHMVPRPDRATETRTIQGFAHGPASASSTAQIGGALQVVTISFVNTTLMKPSNHIALWSEARFEFVPEPGLTLLLASGVAALALIGRHRLRR